MKKDTGSKIADKIVPYKELVTKAKDWISEKVVLVGGCFDLLHLGHVSFLKEAKEQGTLLCVVVESDEFIIRYKKRKPFHTQQERALIVSRLIDVDGVVLLPYLKSDSEYLKLVQIVNPSVIVVTEGDSQYENKKRQIESIGGSIHTVKKIKNFSSSKIGKYETLFRN